MTSADGRRRTAGARVRPRAPAGRPGCPQVPAAPTGGRGLGRPGCGHDGTVVEEPRAVGTLVGYARVSTARQELAGQEQALTQAGCARVFAESTPAGGPRGAGAQPELGRLLDYLRPGDTVVVTRLDRLGRSLRELLATVAAIEGRQAHLRSLREQLDTASPGGRLVFHVFAALAEWEREVIRERTRAGLDAARARGVRLGTQPKLNPEQRALLCSLREEGATVAALARVFGVGRATVYRALAEGEQR